MDESNIEFSWINFKVKKNDHMKLSMILKIQRLSISQAMRLLIKEYVEKNKHLAASIFDDD